MKDQRTAQAKSVMDTFLDVIAETVEEAGAQGAPSGHVYAALNTVGVTLQAYELMVQLLVVRGRVAQRGDVLYPVGPAARIEVAEAHSSWKK